MDNGHTLSCNRLVPKRWCCFFFIFCVYMGEKETFLFLQLSGCVTQTKMLYFFGTFPLSSWPGGSWPPWWKKAHYFTYISGVLGLPDKNDSWIWSRQEGEHVTHSALYFMPPNFQSLFVVLLDYYCFQAILQQCNLSLRCHWFVALNQYWFYSPPLNQDSKVIVVGGPPDAILISVAPLPSIIRTPKIGKQLRERSQ